MTKNVYSPQGKNTDVFKYVDDALKGKQDTLTGTQGKSLALMQMETPLPRMLPKAESPVLITGEELFRRKRATTPPPIFRFQTVKPFRRNTKAES